MNLITEIMLTVLALISLPKAALADEESLSISPRDFISKACKSASDVEACKVIVGSIIGSNPRDMDLDASKVAFESAREVQTRYEEVAASIKEATKENKDSKVRTSLSNCYKMYMDIAHQMGLTLGHLKKENEVCKAREFANSADANPKLCEDGLVQAGTSGNALGFYKDYNDLQDIAGACDSIIAYMIESKNLNTEDCKKQ